MHFILWSKVELFSIINIYYVYLFNKFILVQMIRILYFRASVLSILYSQPPFTALLYNLTTREDYSRPTNTLPMPRLPLQLFETGFHARNSNLILCGPTTWPRHIPGPHVRPTPLVPRHVDCYSSAPAETDFLARNCKVLLWVGVLYLTFTYQEPMWTTPWSVTTAYSVVQR